MWSSLQVGTLLKVFTISHQPKLKTRKCGPPFRLGHYWKSWRWHLAGHQPMASDDPGTTIQDHSKLLKVPVAQVYILQVASIYRGHAFPPPGRLDTRRSLLRSLPFLGPNSHNLVHMENTYGRCRYITIHLGGPRISNFLEEHASRPPKATLYTASPRLSVPDHRQEGKHFTSGYLCACAAE